MLVRGTNRRALIAGLGSAVAAWPVLALGQQPDRSKRIGVLMDTDENDPFAQARLTKLRERLKELGWTEGQNFRLDIRWGSGSTAQFLRLAAELVSLAPDVLVAPTTSTVAALQRATPTIPIVFTGVIDPVGAGIVESLAHPGGNATGFIGFEYTIGAKWLELLKEIAPHVTRVAVLRDPSIAAGIGQFAAIQATGETAINLSVIPSQDAGKIEQGIAAFARSPSGGAHRDRKPLRSKPS